MALTFRKALPSEGGDADRVLRTAFTPYVRKLGRELTPPRHGKDSHMRVQMAKRLEAANF